MLQPRRPRAPPGARTGRGPSLPFTRPARRHRPPPHAALPSPEVSSILDQCDALWPGWRGGQSPPPSPPNAAAALRAAADAAASTPIRDRFDAARDPRVKALVRALGLEEEGGGGSAGGPPLLLLPAPRLADAAVALGILGGRDLFEGAMEGLVGQVGVAVSTLSPAQAVEVARGLALASHLPPPDLVAALEARACEGVAVATGSKKGATALHPATIGAAIWAFASLAHPPDALLAAAAFPSAVAPRLAPRPAAAAAWGLAVSGRGGGPSAAALAGQLVALGADNLTARTGPRGLRQVHWASLAARLLAEDGGEESGGGSGRTPALSPSTSPAARAWAAADGRPDSVTDAAAVATARDARGNTRSSALQGSVVRQVASLLGKGVVQVEGACPVTGLVVDALLPASRLAADYAGPPLGVAVEVDGPTHFFRGKAAVVAAPGGATTTTTCLPTPPTSLKRRLLAAAGWGLVSIDAQAWGELGSSEAEAAFVRGVLREVGACR